MPEPSRVDRNIQVASKGHCTAYAVMHDRDGSSTQFQGESYLELTHLVFLRSLPEVVGLREQVRFDYGQGDGEEHYFDILADFRDGTRIAYTVKPVVRLQSGKFLERMQVIAHWVKRISFADGVRLLTDRDLDDIQRHNGRLLAGTFDLDPVADQAVIAIAGGLRGAISIREITIATSLGERGYRAVLRLLKVGALKLAKHEKITPNALVAWKGDRK